MTTHAEGQAHSIEYWIGRPIQVRINKPSPHSKSNALSILPLRDILLVIDTDKDIFILVGGFLIDTECVMWSGRWIGILTIKNKRYISSTA